MERIRNEIFRKIIIDSFNNFHVSKHTHVLANGTRFADFQVIECHAITKIPLLNNSAVAGKSFEILLKPFLTKVTRGCFQ